MICSFHFNNLVCVLPARQSSSIILIPCNIDCFKRRVKRLKSLLLKFTNFHNLSSNKNDNFNHKHENRIDFNPIDKYKPKQDYLLTIVYIFLSCVALLSIYCPKVDATSSSSSSNPWSQSNRYFHNNNKQNYHQSTSSSSTTLINDRNRLKQQSTTIPKYSGPNFRPPSSSSSSSSSSKINQRISNNNTNVWTKRVVSNYGDGNISSPSRILNSGDTIIPTSLSSSLSSFPPFSSIPSSQSDSSSSSVHFPSDQLPSGINSNSNGQVNGYISVASSILPETFYQKTLKRQSSSASSLNGLYSLDERNNNTSSNSPSPSSSSSSSLSSSLTSSSLSIQPSTPLTLNHKPHSPSLQLQSQLSLSLPSPTTTHSPSESPLLLLSSSSSPSPYLPSSSPTPSSLSATTLGYHIAEDRLTSIDIRDLLRKELDERVMEQQKAKQPQHHHNQHQQSHSHSQQAHSTPLPSSSVNLFALLPPKRDDLDRLASNNNKNTGGITSLGGSQSQSPPNRINGITNGHSRSPPGINILVFKPNTPFKGSSDEGPSDSNKNWGETFGLPPRIPLKPGGYNDPNSPSSPPTTDNRNKIINYHRGSGTNNFNLNHHNNNNNDGFRVYSDKEGENIGINYINRNDDNSGSSIVRNKPSSTTTTSTSTIQPITKTNLTTLLTVGGSGNNNVIKKVTDTIDYSANDFNNNNINNNHNGNNNNNNNDRSGGNSGQRPNGNNHDRYDYDYDGHGIADANGTSTSLSESNGPDDAFVNGEAYRLTTERLAYILIGSCCALSILCLIIVAFSIRCRDMCDEYKAWKKAEKLAMLNYRYQNSHARQRIRSGIPGNGSASGPVGRVVGGPEANFFSHRALGEQDSNLSYPPIKASRPIFGPSCCCCPAPGSTGSAWHGRGTETCPRGYFHPCPRGKLPFGAASSIQAFPRNHVPVAAVANNFPSDEDDSLNASIVDDGRAGPSGVTVSNGGGPGVMDPKGVILDSSEAHHGHNLNQCTCVEPPAPSAFDSESTGQPNNRHHHGHNHINHTHGHSSNQQPSGQPQASSSSNHHHIHHQHVHQQHQQHHHQQQQQQRKQQQLNPSQTNGENDKSFNPSWLQSSIIVDELHRKHSQLVRENAKSPKSRNPEDQRYIFWSENQDRLI